MRLVTVLEEVKLLHICCGFIHTYKEASGTLVNNTGEFFKLIMQIIYRSLSQLHIILIQNIGIIINNVPNIHNTWDAVEIRVCSIRFIALFTITLSSDCTFNKYN